MQGKKSCGDGEAHLVGEIWLFILRAEVFHAQAGKEASAIYRRGEKVV